MRAILTILLLSFSTYCFAGGKTVGEKKKYTKQQLRNQGKTEKLKYTTCLLVKRVKTRGGEVCIYRGGNMTHELVIEQKCPRQFKCIYNPWSPVPKIGDIIESLNTIKD